MITPTQNRRSRNALLLSALAVVMTVGVTGSHSPVSRLPRVSDQVSETITSNQEAGNDGEQKEPQREDPVRVEADPLYEPRFIPGFEQTPCWEQTEKCLTDVNYLRNKFEFRDDEYHPKPWPYIRSDEQRAFNFRMINSAEKTSFPLNGEDFLCMRFQYREQEHRRQCHLFGAAGTGWDDRYKNYNPKIQKILTGQWRFAPVNEAAWEGLQYPGDRIELMEKYRCILTKGNMHITSRNEQERITRKKMREDLDNRLAKCSTKDLLSKTLETKIWI